MNEGDIVKGKVTCIQPYGAFVELSGGQTALVHISEISDRFVERIDEFLTIGRTYRFKVINIDEHGRISLSLKALKKRKRMKVHLKKGFAPLRKRLHTWIREYHEKQHEKEEQDD